MGNWCFLKQGEPCRKRKNQGYDGHGSSQVSLGGPVHGFDGEEHSS